jgi:hypothetical protein
MVKSKIKRNPYAQFYLNQVEILEQQRRYWLKHPESFIKSLTGFMVLANNNLSMKDRIKLEKILEEK